MAESLIKKLGELKTSEVQNKKLLDALTGFISEQEDKKKVEFSRLALELDSLKTKENQLTIKRDEITKQLAAIEASIKETQKQQDETKVVEKQVADAISRKEMRQAKLAALQVEIKAIEDQLASNEPEKVAEEDSDDIEMIALRHMESKKAKTKKFEFRIPPTKPVEEVLADGRIEETVVLDDPPSELIGNIEEFGHGPEEFGHGPEESQVETEKEEEEQNSDDEEEEEEEKPKLKLRKGNPVIKKKAEEEEFDEHDGKFSFQGRNYAYKFAITNEIDDLTIVYRVKIGGVLLKNLRDHFFHMCGDRKIQTKSQRFKEYWDIQKSNVTINGLTEICEYVMVNKRSTTKKCHFCERGIYDDLVCHGYRNGDEEDFCNHPYHYVCAAVLKAFRSSKEEEEENPYPFCCIGMAASNPKQKHCVLGRANPCATASQINYTSKKKVSPSKKSPAKKKARIEEEEEE